MSVSSRTPEGQPGRCPICGHEAALLPSELIADAPCPKCGTLLWPIATHESSYLLATAALTPEQRRTLRELIARAAKPNLDSLDQIEIVMDLEELCDLSIPDDVAVRLTSLGDVLDYLESGGDHGRGSDG